MSESYIIRQLRKAKERDSSTNLYPEDVRELLFCLDDYANRLKNAAGEVQFWGGQAAKHKREKAKLQGRLLKLMPKKETT